jgi:hypothetical protein
MVVFLFTQVSMTALLLAHIEPCYHWKHNLNLYEVLPYLRDAFGNALRQFQDKLPDPLKKDLTNAVSQLCDPEPLRRGHPLARIGHHDPYSLERYISLFDRLAKLYEYRLAG